VGVSSWPVELAGEHCHEGALTLFHQRMFDWLDDTLR
jgi:hypothetical protein